MAPSRWARPANFGAGNGAGTGCEGQLPVLLHQDAGQLPRRNPCNGAEACQIVMVNGKSGQKCAAGVPQADGTACGNGSICVATVCKLAACGDASSPPPSSATSAPAMARAPAARPIAGYSCGKMPDTCPDANPCNGARSA